MNHPPASDELVFYVNGHKIVEKNADPEVTLLSYLRKSLCLTGTKYGCGGGGCGACTVMVSTVHPISKKILHYPATACLLPICSLNDMAVTTTEGIGNSQRLHPVQERIAKAHGTQCGFCTPGMVMSMYALVRNHPEPTMDQIMDALSGNLCRCTGYRPILDGCKTFTKDCCQSNKVAATKSPAKKKCCQNKKDEENQIPKIKNSPLLFNKTAFLPLDKTQELIFPPELQMKVAGQQTMKVYQGERVTWYSPSTLQELLHLRTKYPKAPLVVGNTNIGLKKNLQGIFHPVIISPIRVHELYTVASNDLGIIVGAAVTLAQLKVILSENIQKLPTEKTKTFRALNQQLKTLAGEQIRNMATLGGHIASRLAISDLNPVLAAAGAQLNVVSKDSHRQLLLNKSFFDAETSVIGPAEVVLSVFIPYSQKEEFVSAFRQAQRERNAYAIVNAGMRVRFTEGTDIIQEMAIFYGCIGSTTLSAKRTSDTLRGRHWDDKMFQEACRLVLEEISIPPSAPGGMVEYKRTLVTSYLFKFYLQVLLELKKTVTFSGPATEYLSCLKDFETEMPKTTQIFQEVNAEQPAQDTVGRPIAHVSGIKQATGEAVYVDDMPRVDKELFIAFATSTRAHAKILSIDAAEAHKVPGVMDVIRAKDVPGINAVDKQGPLFSEDKVECVGQIICAVVADTPDHARRAAAKIKITYENIEPAIVTIQDAIKYKSFYEPTRSIKHGNAEEAFKTADHVFEGEIHICGQEHFYLETQTVLVVPKGEENEFDIHVSSQAITLSQSAIAAVLGVPMNRLMCHVKRVGGAFGGKITKPGIFAAAAAVAAQKTKRPVRCVLERGEDMLITAGRHPFFAKYKVGCMSNGKIVSADVSVYTNAGCSLDESILVLSVSLAKLDNAYNVPNLNCSAIACKTNLPSNTAFRGFGFPQGGFVIETIIEAIASKCGLPTHKVRELNLYKGISRTHYKQEFDSTNLMRCWEECMQKSSFYKKRAEIQEFNKKNYWKKKGLAIVPIKYSVGFIENPFHQAGALVNIFMDGNVLVSHGGVEMGQGVHTKVIQIASRVLKIPMSNIYICNTNVASVPNSIASGGGFGTDLYGFAVKEACETLMKRLEPVIAQNPNGKWNEWIMGAFLQKISLSATGFFDGYNTYMDWEKGEGHAGPYDLFGAGCSEIELDCLTGAHKNLRTDIVVDIGQSINPAIDIGQVEGAFAQGVGLYTMEQLHYSPQGELYTRGPDQYKIPAVFDVPTEFNVSILASSYNPVTIYSSKGLGELAVFLGCTVFFALKDAISSAREERGLTKDYIFNSPLTPERVRMACADHITDMIPRDKDGTFTPWSVDVSH